LLYHHYDVQPEDPVDAWHSPPFELTEHDGALYGRGAADDKGELVSRLAALQCYRSRHGELPLGVKFVVEGEEEIGSPHLAPFVHANAERLAADVALWEFGAVDAAGRPTTYCGMKGILTVELHVRTALHDLHSGYGVVVDDAAYRLAAAVASLRNADGAVTIDGFRDGIVPPTAAERALVDALPDEDVALREAFGIARFLGDLQGAPWRQALFFEPTVNVNGLRSGYGGEGAKTVLPAEALAKLDFRLVPDQDPWAVLERLREHLTAHGFDDVEVRVLQHAERAARSDVGHPFVQEGLAALRDVYGVEPTLHPNSPGSGPIHPFVIGLGLSVLGIGCGYPGSRIHAPDEHLRLADFELGTLAVARFLERLSGR
jgi:acetylornithine deacetylase/succinyl-diaminopimelate desuccinylase-like protein